MWNKAKIISENKLIDPTKKFDYGRSHKLDYGQTEKQATNAAITVL